MKLWPALLLGATLIMTAGSASAADVKILDTKVGTGDAAVNGKTLSVHYDGYLSDAGKKGKKFDSSRDRGAPFSLVLGAHQVIPGWEQGLQGMKVGGTRTLTIPPELGYGTRGAGGVIPPNAELIFDVELMGVK